MSWCQPDVSRRSAGTDTSRLRRAAVSLSAAALLVAGCGADEPEAATADPDGVEIRIVAPADGSEVEQPFDVELEVTGVEIGEVATGAHHVHFYVGDAEFDPHYSTGPYRVDAASSGEQTIRVEVARANHDEIGVADAITLTVAGDPEPAAEDEMPSPGY